MGEQELKIWLENHEWFLRHHGIPEIEISYVYRCGFLAGVEYGQNLLMKKFNEIFGDLPEIKTTQH